MDSVEILFIAVAALSIIILSVVFIKFKNLKITLVTGLAIVALILGVILFMGEKNDVKSDGDDIVLNSTGISTPSADVTTSDKLDKDATASVPSDTVLATGTILSTAVPTAQSTDSIYKTSQPAETANPEIGKNSVIYLTFDDGPSERTIEVLDILKKYNVKATFFIINFYEWQIPILQRIIDEGHSIGIHGYSHVYSEIYKSEASFMKNITDLRDKINKMLGYDTTLIRFPGGSSSSQAEKTCAGIMAKLVGKVENDGYQYFDWNVDSGDAEGFNAAGIINRIKTGTKDSRTYNIVLMHDTVDKIETVKSLPEIIEWGIANGYIFSNLDSSSPTAHHRTAN